MVNDKLSLKALLASSKDTPCFSRLVFGKNLFEEYAKFEIPQELKK